MRERTDLGLNLKVRIFLIILVGSLVVGGVYMINPYFMHSNSGPSRENFTGLRNYTVENGDSIFTIAGKYGVSISALKQANGLDPSTMTPGQVLTIPNKPSSDWYTVESGDSLYYIATKYKVSNDALQKINALKSALILPGQVLVIPPIEEKIAYTSTIKYNPALKVQILPTKSVNRPLAEIFKEKGINKNGSRIAILIDKSEHTLSLYVGGVRLKTYSVELGNGGFEDKEVQGDHKTPEGAFYIAEKSVLKPADKFLGSRWLRLSYPNIEDAERGIHQGLIDQMTHDAIMTAWKNKDIPPQYTALGGGVGIHGGNSKEQGSNWTWGCIGLNNGDIEDFFDFVTVGTPIFIQR
jgi:LysM repeat protein